MNEGAIIGIIVFAIVAVVLLASIILKMRLKAIKRRKRIRQNEPNIAYIYGNTAIQSTQPTFATTSTAPRPQSLSSNFDFSTIDLAEQQQAYNKYSNNSNNLQNNPNTTSLTALESEHRAYQQFYSNDDAIEKYRKQQPYNPHY